MSLIAWTSGNRVQLLENGEAFFPRVFDAIDAAREEVRVETFIVAEDEVGLRLRDALAAAAGRGLRVHLLLDSYGSAPLSAEFLLSLQAAGVQLRWFDPQPLRLGMRTNLFRRLHRKLVLLDGTIAFVGGINFSLQHLRCAGPDSKQDYAVELRGPLVAQVREAMGAVPPPQRRWSVAAWLRGRREEVLPPVQRAARAALVLRDNHRHRQDIERVYRLGIRTAQTEIIIANAYFFPGYRLLRELRAAAQRGVAVHLLLQGKPDLRMVRWAAGTLYDYLLRGGVHIHEYCERPLHGKVAVIDGLWVTVGSSNLDPLSLFLNLEANVVAQDRRLAAALRRSLRRLIREQCKEPQVPAASLSTPLRQALGFASFHLLRRLPRLAGWLPAHASPHGPVRAAASAADAPELVRAPPVGVTGVRGVPRTAQNRREAMSAQEVVKVLNRLIEVSQDGRKGFAEAAEYAQDAGLKSAFMLRSTQCADAVRELQEAVEIIGNEPAGQGSVAGAAHRGWIKLKAAVSDNNDVAVLEEVERGEDHARAAYTRALKTRLPPEVRRIVERQSQGVQQNHDRVRALRDRCRAAA